jgi:hypothetical protein
MKVLIRDVKTGFYLTQDGWAAEVNTARDFERGADAISFAMRNALKDIEIVHAFPEGEFNFSTGVIDFSLKHLQPRAF